MNNGAIVIIYKKDDGEISYLLPTQKSGMANFVGGGRELEDKDDEDNIRREIGEETTLKEADYKLAETDIYHRFVYSGKKERDGREWSNKVFITEVSSDLEIQPTREIESLNWYSEDEAINTLSFDDMKAVFREAVALIKGKT